MSFHDESQIEFTYGRSRRQRRQLVALMWVGTLLVLVGSNLRIPRMEYGDSVRWVMVLGGLLLAFTCYFVLSLLMKDINGKPLNKLDERQALVSGRAYRNAWIILMICATLVYMLALAGWLRWLELSVGGIWLLSMTHSLPMAVMAWTEPD